LKPRMRIRPGPGKPARSPRGPAPSTSVRVHEYVKVVLDRNFGSLAAALYYLYEGIQEFKALHNLPVDVEQIDIDPWIEFEDLKLTQKALLHYIMYPPTNDARTVRPYKRFLLRLSSVLDPIVDRAELKQRRLNK